MNILLTGITGLFGSQLAYVFRSLGTIHGLKRTSSSTEQVDVLGLSVQWHEGNVMDVTSLMEAMQGIDLVIHAAGKVSFDPKDEKEVLFINQQGTANVVNAMLAMGIRRLVHVSSVAALGQVPEREMYDEKVSWVDSPEQTAYALSKYWAELEVWRGEQEGLEVLVVNPSILLGKASYAQSSGLLYQYVQQGHSFFPAGSINTIDVRDAAEITRALVDKNAWGERFILSKGSLSYREFFQEVAEVLGGKAPGRELPTWCISVFVPFLRILSLFGMGQASVSKQAAKNAQRKVHYTHTKVQHLLQFSYRELRDTLNWAKSS